MAIATSMATILFTSPAVRAHHKRGAVRWDIVVALAPGIRAGCAIWLSLGVFALLNTKRRWVLGVLPSSCIFRLSRCWTI
jgi:uncharacterized membrane protein YfcA